MIYKIPVIWQSYGIMHIEADSLEEAKEKVFSFETPLPDNPGYIDDSIEIDEEGLIILENYED